MSSPAAPASLGLRVLAGLYDLLPMLGLWFGAGALALLFTGGALDPHRAIHKLLVQCLVVMLTAGYFVVSWSRGGQTLGMRAWHLRVVRADGTRLGAACALLRFVIALLSVAVVGAGFWWSLIDARRRTWHDIAARTLLVRDGRGPLTADPEK